MKPLLKILRYTSELWKYYAVIASLTVILSAAQLLQPVLTGRMIDVLKSGTGNDVRTIVSLVVAL